MSPKSSAPLSDRVSNRFNEQRYHLGNACGTLLHVHFSQSLFILEQGVQVFLAPAIPWPLLYSSRVHLRRQKTDHDNNDEDDEQQPATESSTSSPILTFLSTRESTNTGAVFVLGKGDFNIDIVVDIKIYMDIGSHVDIDVDACIAIAIQVMMIMMKIT